ncbi:40S ribosomal protein S5-1 [Hordeum vulgare]|nr:40S ribosomal protein S5-1 [Hordeum vulgare]
MKPSMMKKSDHFLPYLDHDICQGCREHLSDDVVLMKPGDGDGRRGDKIFEKVINPYLRRVLQHPQSIEMREGMLHIRDVEGPKNTGSMETRLEAMKQQLFKCQGMVERGLNANHMMITEFTNKHMIDANDIGKHLSRLYDRIDQL